MIQKPDEKFFQEAIDYLIPVIKQAGTMALENWDKIEIYKQKDARDIATKADIEIENFIKGKIMTKWPEHGFWGEESEKINQDSPFQWLIDPIDGSKFYASLAPFFQTYIALVYEGEPVLGLIYNPLSHQLFSAYQGSGTYLNGEKITLKEPVFLRDAIINIDFGGLAGKNEPEKEWMLDKLSQITEKSYRVRMIAGALNVYIVTGTIDAYIDLGDSKPQDLAARIIVMQEAGFIIEKIETNFGEKLLVAREPILSELRQILLN